MQFCLFFYSTFAFGHKQVANSHQFLSLMPDPLTKLSHCQLAALDAYIWNNLFYLFSFALSVFAQDSNSNADEWHFDGLDIFMM